MASRKSTDLERDAEALLRPGHVPAPELVAAIHAVNPTGLDLAPALELRRYALKSKLQSRLVLDYFPELDFEPVAHEPGVIGLRYRPQDRDACHAVIADLSEAARSQVQFHLDTSERSTASHVAATAQRSPRRTTGSLAEGRAALAEYDYDRARVCFEEALEASDDEAPAIALLELLVDTLAAWPDALALEERLTPRQLTPPVRTLLALAAAHARDAAACARLAKELESPRLAEAFCILATQALERSDFTEATRLLAEAKRLDGTAPQIVVVTAELARLKAAQREPAERELQSLLASGAEAKAEEHARHLLERWPESTLARRVLRDVAEKRTSATVARLEHQAQTAFDAGDDETAIALWGESVQLGATGLEKKLAAASSRRHEREQSARIAEVVRVLSTNLGEASLGKYLELEAGERDQVRKLTGEETLGWLEELEASGSREWKLDASAVLALKEARGRADVPVFTGPTHARVLRLEAGRALLAAADAALRASAFATARANLRSAQLAMTEGRWRDAIELVATDLGEEARRIAAAALGHLESEARTERFQTLMQHGDTLQALDVLRAVDADETEDKPAWATRRAAVTKALQSQLRVEVFTSPTGIPACDVVARPGIDLSHGLDERGEFAWLATGFDRELFVRKVRVVDQRVVELVALTAPAPFDFPEVRVEGATLWVTNDEGAAIQLSLDTWAVLRWHCARVDEGSGVDGTLVTPGGRFHWLSVRSKENGDEVLRIIDLERNKVQRELPKEGLSLSLVATSKGPRVWLSGFRRGGRIFSFVGATEQTLPMGLEQVSIGPDGSGFFGVARPEEGEEEESDEGLRVLFLREGSSEPELIEELEDSFNDGVLEVATARDAKVSFVLYAGQEEGGCQLVAYAPDGQSVKRRWRVRCPARALLLHDLEARRVFLVAAHDGAFRCIPLTAQEPDLSDVMAQVSETHLPRIYSDGPSCSLDHDSTLGQITQLIQRAPEGPARQRALQRVLEEQEDHPEALVYVARNLGSWRLRAEATAVRALAKQRFPNHPLVALDVAEEAVEKGQWPFALEALQAVRESELSPRMRDHWHHLRGLALFHLDRPEEAKEALVTAQGKDHSGCYLAGWSDWLDAVMGKDPNGSAGRLLTLVHQADVALAAGKTRVALELLDVPLVWGTLDVHLAARMASAALVEPTGPRTRLIVASFLKEQGSRRALTMPFGKLAWSQDQLEDLAGRGRTWLERVGH